MAQYARRCTEGQVRPLTDFGVDDWRSCGSFHF